MRQGGGRGEPGFLEGGCGVRVHSECKSPKRSGGHERPPGIGLRKGGEGKTTQKSRIAPPKTPEDRAPGRV